MTGQPLGDTPPTRRRARAARTAPNLATGAMAAAAIRWTRTGGEPPPELAHLHPDDQELLYRSALACDPDIQQALLEQHPPRTQPGTDQ